MTQTSLFDLQPAPEPAKLETKPKPVKTPKAKQPKAPEPQPDRHAEGKRRIKAMADKIVPFIAAKANAMPTALWVGILDTFFDLGSHSAAGQEDELQIAALVLDCEPHEVRTGLSADADECRWVGSMLASAVIILSHIISLDVTLWAEDAELLIAQAAGLTLRELTGPDKPKAPKSPPKPRAKKAAKAKEPEPELDEEDEVPLEDPDEDELCERCLAPSPRDELVRLDGQRQCRKCRAPKGTEGPELDAGLLDRIKANLLSPETP